MQSPLVSTMGFSPLTLGSVPSPLMVWYAMIYCVIRLAVAILIFSQRDL